MGDERQYEKLYMDGGREEKVNEGVHAIIVFTPARVLLRILPGQPKIILLRQ